MDNLAPTRETRAAMWALAEEHLRAALSRIQDARSADGPLQAESVVVAAKAGARMASAVLDSFGLPRRQR